MQMDRDDCTNVKCNLIDQNWNPHSHECSTGILYFWHYPLTILIHLRVNIEGEKQSNQGNKDHVFCKMAPHTTPMITQDRRTSVTRCNARTFFRHQKPDCVDPNTALKDLNNVQVWRHEVQDIFGRREWCPCMLIRVYHATFVRDPHQTFAITKVPAGTRYPRYISSCRVVRPTEVDVSIYICWNAAPY